MDIVEVEHKKDIFPFCMRELLWKFDLHQAFSVVDTGIILFLKYLQFDSLKCS